MSSNGENLSEVRIGNVSGGIHGSVFAGRDVSKVTITLGGQAAPADKDPTPDELRQLLAEVQQALAAITAQPAALEQVSDDAELYATAAAKSLNKAAEKVAATDEMAPEEAESIQKSLDKAAGTLNGILDEAKSVAQKATAVGRAAKPIAEALAPVVEKLAVAALWVGRLWLGA